MDQATTAMRPLLRHAHFQSKFQVLLLATSRRLALESLGTLQLAKVVAQLHNTNYLETMATAVALTSRLTLTKYNLDQSCMLTTSLLTRNLQVRRSTSKLLLSTQSETLPVNLLCWHFALFHLNHILPQLKISTWPRCPKSWLTSLTSIRTTVAAQSYRQNYRWMTAVQEISEFCF